MMKRLQDGAPKTAKLVYKPHELYIVIYHYISTINHIVESLIRQLNRGSIPRFGSECCSKDMCLMAIQGRKDCCRELVMVVAIYHLVI